MIDLTGLERPLSAQTAATDALLNQAIEAHQQWDFERAEALYTQTLQNDPLHADAHHNMGVLLAVQLLRPLESLAHFEAALNADPARAQFWFSYIDGLLRCQHFDLARQVLPLAQAQGLHLAMVNALAERLPRRVVESAAPDGPLSASAKQQELVCVPNRPGHSQGTLVSRTVAASPNRQPSDADMRVVVSLFESRDLVAGTAAARELVRRYPRHGFGWKVLGTFLHLLGAGEEAIAAKRKAVELMPQDAEAIGNLGQSLQDAGHYAAAEIALQRALALRPDYAEAHNNLAITYQKMGRIANSIEHFRAALEIQPLHQWIFDNYLFTLNYHPDMAAEEIFEAYREYERRFGAPFRVQWIAHKNNRNPHRRLKVGYVSPDFKTHSCAFFLEPLLARHDPARFEVTAYAELNREDAVSQRYPLGQPHASLGPERPMDRHGASRSAQRARHSANDSRYRLAHA